MAASDQTFVTGEFGMAFRGYVWHRIYQDGTLTICGMKTDGNWAIGQPHPDSRYENYCKKCMKSSGFRVVKGAIVR